MVDIADNKLNQAREKLVRIRNPNANAASLISKLTHSIDETLAHVNEQQGWLKGYFSKGKAGRKSMLNGTRITWLGVH